MEGLEVLENGTQVQEPMEQPVSDAVQPTQNGNVLPSEVVGNQIAEGNREVVGNLTKMMQEYVDIRDEQEGETYVQIADAAASRAVEQYANETEIDGAGNVNATISAGQWEYIQSQMQLGSTLSLFLLLLVAATIGVLLYREFSRGFRR